jgi:hypothetical protein
MRHAKVKDIIATTVASVNGSTPFKDIAETLIAHGISTVPDCARATTRARSPREPRC